MTPTRRIASVVAVLSVAALLLSGWLMARAVQAFNRRTPPAIFVFQPVTDRQFTYAGRPVSFTEEPAQPGNTPTLLVAYADETLRLRVTIPGESKLPGLLPYENWLRVLRFAPLGTDSAEGVAAKIKSGQIADRLVIVTRTPQPGADTKTWGEVWRNDWTFDFYELLPDGTIAHERLGFPTARRGQPSRTDEIREGTWQFQAALSVVPSGYAPKYTFTQNALSDPRVKTALAVAELSILALLASLAVAFAPRRPLIVRDASASSRRNGVARIDTEP